MTHFNRNSDRLDVKRCSIMHSRLQIPRLYTRTIKYEDHRGGSGYLVTPPFIFFLYTGEKNIKEKRR